MSKKRRAGRPAAAPAATVALAGPRRAQRLDTLRGFALVWMAVFHFCFDLSQRGLLTADFYNDPLWTQQRAAIVSIFLLCVGAGQALALANGQTWRQFWRRWAQVAACALLVTVASRLMFPASYIYFGVLHGIAVMLIVARLTAPLKSLLWPLGAVALALPQVVQHPVFNPPAWNWIGLVSAKPITEDYVPLLPWLGVVWWGLAATRWLLEKHPAWLAGSGYRPLAALGRWSLSFYMLHQPFLLGGLAIWLWLSGRL